MSTKFNVEDDTVDNKVQGTQILINEGMEWFLEWVECPYCHGLFAVDVTYLDQVETVVHCPMCCLEVEFDGWE